MEHWNATGNPPRTIKIAQIVLHQNRVNDGLSELHGGPSGGHLGVNKTLDKV
jgi:hypothetical protein